VIPHKDVFTKVDPRAVTGHTYTIAKQESKATTDKLKAWKQVDVFPYLYKNQALVCVITLSKTTTGIIVQ